MISDSIANILNMVCNSPRGIGWAIPKDWARMIIALERLQLKQSAIILLVRNQQHFREMVKLLGLRSPGWVIIVYIMVSGSQTRTGLEIRR